MKKRIYESATHFTHGVVNKEFLSTLPPAFYDAWQKTMKWEGGGKAHEVTGDTGGLTKWGISKKSYKHLDIKNLTERDALTIAYQDYWLLMHCDKIATVCADTATHVFDIGFNAGHKWGIKLLQRAINSVNNNKALKDDGIYGNMTHRALKNCNNYLLANALVNERVKHYKWLTIKNPINRKFIKGWLNRANYFKKTT
jgi:lysozyme family protein